MYFLTPPPRHTHIQRCRTTGTSVLSPHANTAQIHPASDQSGYYIQANVGVPHPITLQVTPLAARIFRHTGFTPDEAVPTKLVWAMYELDLVYTNESLATTTHQTVATADVVRDLDLGNKLSPADREALIDYIDSYTGPQTETLHKLKQELTEATGPATATATPPKAPPDTAAEALSQLFELTADPTEFRTAKRNCDHQYLRQSLQTFLPWPHLDFAATTLTANWHLEYTIHDPASSARGFVCDLRSVDGDTGSGAPLYRIRMPDGDGEATATWTADGIQSFTPATDGDYTKTDLNADLAWLLPDGAVPFTQAVTDGTTTIAGRTLAPRDADIEPAADQLHVVEVDRISTAGNPVVETTDGHHILDTGTPGDRFLVTAVDSRHLQAVAQIDE